MATATKHRIAPQTGLSLEVPCGQVLRVVDVQGEQVADLVAFARKDLGEWLSNGRSFDYNGTIYMTTGHVLYSNRSNPMLTFVEDKVGRHDFLHAPCSQEMFQIQYGHSDAHPNCLENLANALSSYGIRESMIPTPLNIFMNVEVLRNGELRIDPPLSRPGDYIDLRAEMDLIVGVTACSAGSCNNQQCTAIDVELY